MAQRLGILGCWVAVCATLAAADFWEEKEFPAWSDEEVERMLTDSPWSREVVVSLWTIPDPRLRPRPVGVDGGPGNTGGLRPVPDDESSGGRRHTSGFSARRQLSLTVSWRSALPVKQALVRRQFRPQRVTDLAPAQWSFLVDAGPVYIVSITGFPPSFARLAEDLDALEAGAVLERRGKPAITAEQVEMLVQNDADVAFRYTFSRDDPITVNDERVEFVAPFDDFEVKGAFDLEDMVFGGELRL